MTGVGQRCPSTVGLIQLTHIYVVMTFVRWMLQLLVFPSHLTSLTVNIMRGSCLRDSALSLVESLFFRHTYPWPSYFENFYCFSSMICNLGWNLLPIILQINKTLIHWPVFIPDLSSPQLEGISASLNRFPLGSNLLVGTEICPVFRVVQFGVYERKSGRYLIKSGFLFHVHWLQFRNVFEWNQRLHETLRLRRVFWQQKGKILNTPVKRLS